MLLASCACHCLHCLSQCLQCLRRVPHCLSWRRAETWASWGRVGILVAALGLGLERAGAEELGRLLSAGAHIRASQLQMHVATLADDSLEGREAGSRGGRAAGAYLLQQFQRSLEAVGGQLQVQPFGAGYRNLLGQLEGSDPQRHSEYVLLGAHYDHLGYGSARNSLGPIGYIHNGADDNASGTAAVLEILDAFSRSGLRPARTVLFALWDGEEKGLLGSQHWVHHPTVPLQQVKLAINLDMVGRLRDRRVEVYGTRTMTGLRSLVSHANSDLGLRLDFLWKLEPNGDHHTFFSRQIPIVMFHTGLHDQYHRPSDDAELINAAGLELVARLVFGTVVRAAEAPLGSFRTLSRQEGLAARRTFEQPLAPPPARLGISWSPVPTGSSGLRVTSVRPGSPADEAGVRVGDVLVRFGQQSVEDSVTLQRAVLASEPDVTLEILRQDEPEPVALPARLAGPPGRLGLSWRENSGELGTVTVVRVLRQSPADRAGLRVADRIHRIAGEAFRDRQQFAELARSRPLPMEMLIEREGQLHVLTLPAGTEAVSAPSP